MNPDPFTVRARWVVPVSAAPIEFGYVSIASGTVQSVSGNCPTGTIIDIGEAVLIPGLVNAHTHLEFSDLETPLGTQDGKCGVSFTDWIRLVIQHRIQRPTSTEIRNRVINQGLQESLHAGVVALGEISTSPFQFESESAGEILVVAFLELLGRNLEAIDSRFEEFESAIAEWPDQWVGTSPHAPYSVHPNLLDRMLKLSNQQGLPTAMHLAETPEELQLMQTVDGPFATLFQQLNVWEPDSYSRNQKPLDWLRQLSHVANSLVIHGNYLDDEEIDFISQSPNPMSVVYCPRTHAYFEHKRYPLEKFLNKNINVAIGTDSRASNPDLDLLTELKLVANNFAKLSPETILSLGTMGGARALGIDSELGTIEPGKSARLAVIRSETLNQPFDWLTDPTSNCGPLNQSLSD